MYLVGVAQHAKHHQRHGIGQALAMARLRLRADGEQAVGNHGGCHGGTHQRVKQGRGVMRQYGTLAASGMKGFGLAL